MEKCPNAPWKTMFLYNPVVLRVTLCPLAGVFNRSKMVEFGPFLHKEDAAIGCHTCRVTLVLNRQKPKPRILGVNGSQTSRRCKKIIPTKKNRSNLCPPNKSGATWPAICPQSAKAATKTGLAREEGEILQLPVATAQTFSAVDWRPERTRVTTGASHHGWKRTP